MPNPIKKVAKKVKYYSLVLNFDKPKLIPLISQESYDAISEHDALGGLYMFTRKNLAEFNEEIYKLIK